MRRLPALGLALLLLALVLAACAVAAMLGTDGRIPLNARDGTEWDAIRDGDERLWAEIDGYAAPDEPKLMPPSVRY